MGGGGGGKGGGKGMGGLIISLKMSAISKSSSLILRHYQTNLDLYLTRSLRINRLALTPIIDQDKFFNIKQCEEDM